MLALLMAWQTDDGRWDGVGSLSIGLVLVGVAVFLSVEVKSLLVGESADPEISAAAHELAKAHDKFEDVLSVITVQQGPGEVIVAMKFAPKRGLSAEELCQAINDFETQLRAKCPSVKWCFMEPDLKRAAA
jgi:divalent metal cation (Fe/Co/Zn/Cd) transporter